MCSSKAISAPSRGGFKAGSALALIGGLAALAFLAPTAATAQTASGLCKGGDGNRFTRFIGSSYVAQNQYCGLEAELTAEREALNRAEVRIGKLSSERDMGLARIADLNSALASVSACRENDLEAALVVARAENADLLDSQDNLTSQIAGLDLQIEQLRGKLTNQSAKLDAAQSGEVDLSGEVSDLEAALKAAETEALAIRTERDKLQASYEALGEERRADASRLGADLEVAAANLSACRADFDAFKASASETANASSDLSSQLALARAEIAELRKNTKAMSDAEMDLRNQLAAAKAQLTAVTTTAKQLPETNAALAQAEATVVALEAELTETRDAARVAQQGLSADLSAAQAEITDRDATIAALQAQINGFRAERHADVASLQARLSDLSAEASHVPGLVAGVKSRDSRILELESALTDARAATGNGNGQVAALQALIGKRSADFDRTQAALTAALSSKAALEAKLGMAQSESARAGELSAQLAAANVEIEQLRADAMAARPSASSGELNAALRRWLEQNRNADSESGAALYLDNDKLVLSSGATLFQPGSARLSDGGKALLDSMAGELTSVISTLPGDEDWQLHVLGHADATPAGSRWPSNWELSSFRAAAVVRTLVDAGLPAERLSAVGKGEFHPLIDDTTPEAYAKNRRIELQFR